MHAYPHRYNIGSNAEFHFVSYIQANMEEDFGLLVGLSLTMWLTIIACLLLSWAVGACTLQLQLGSTLNPTP